MTHARMILATVLVAAVCSWAIGAEPASTAPSRAATLEIHRTMLSAWRESISAPDDPNANHLDEASQKLRELMLPGSQKIAPAKTYADPNAAARNPAKAAATMSATTKPTQAEPTTRPVTASKPTTRPAPAEKAPKPKLDVLKAMPLEELADAGPAADALYSAGQYAAALMIYTRLRDHAPADANTRAGTAPDWLIFQSANCNAHLGNQAEATTLFKQLLSQYPSSPWAPVAKVQGDLSAWREQEKPAALLSEVAAETNASLPSTSQTASTVGSR